MKGDQIQFLYTFWNAREFASLSLLSYQQLFSDFVFISGDKRVHIKG